MGPTPAGGVGDTSLPSSPSLLPFPSSPPPPPQRFLQTHVVEEEVSGETRAARGPRLPQHTMIDLDNHHQNEPMQINSEASLGCPQGRTLSLISQNNGNASQGIIEPKDVNDAHSGLGAVESDYLLNFAPPIFGHWIPFYQQVYSTWSTFYTNHQKVQQYPWHSFENFYPVGGEYPFLVDKRVQFSPLNLYSLGYPPEVLIQEFQYFVVVDFEATCDKGKNPQPQEIIEFPSVLVNSATGQLEASFQTYVRPIYHQHLTDFCKELTGIQQIQVDRGVPIIEALLMHDKWLEVKGIKNTNFAVVTWSDWDCHVMLESECKLKRIRKPPYFNRWINLKIPFQEVFGNVRCNLKEAVQLAGLTWEGRAHCGLDDARNTARLLSTLMHHGIKLSITNSHMRHPADCPMEACPPHPLCKSGPTIQLLMPKQPAEPVIQFHPHLHPPSGEKDVYCFCGVMSSKCMVRKPGPKHGSYFSGCGNWTATRGAMCHYFEWAS